MARKLIVLVLLAFVVVALVTAVMRNRGDGGATAGQTGSSAPTATAAAPSASTAHLVAFYFHGTKRCSSCTSIEQLTREALKADTDAGRVEIRSVNVDEAPNAHFTDDFQLTMRTVVLAEEAGGRIVRWQRLDECWDRFGDPPAYLAYVRQSLAAFRGPAAGTR